jgi:hypothetical protein
VREDGWQIWENVDAGVNHSDEIAMHFVCALRCGYEIAQRKRRWLHRFQIEDKRP